MDFASLANIDALSKGSQYCIQKSQNLVTDGYNQPINQVIS